MRQEDEERLEKPFPPNDARTPSEQLAESLDLRVPSAAVLAGCILNDLDPERYGVGWWVGHVGAMRRILIGDQLHLAISSIETNMIEARLHLLEARDFLARSSRQSSLTVTVSRFGQAQELKRQPNAAAHLPHELARMHIVGFFRAIGSALDCLGGGIIGVLALSENLLRADLGRARRALERVVETADPGHSLQFEFGQAFESLVRSAGPEGWLDWALDYRHMLVHRGRHLSPWFQQQTGVQVWINHSTQKVALDSLLLLSREPGRGEVDALRGFRQGHVLTEDAETTLNGLYESASTLIEKTCARLLAVWSMRREQPSLLVQPEAQWPETTPPECGEFAGYSPNKVTFNPSQMVVSVSFGRRLRAAALDADNERRWDTFD